MEKLIEQLNNNISAVIGIDKNIDISLKSKSIGSRQHLLRLYALKKRVLRMRGRILQNIQLETTKHEHHLSSLQRSINLKNVA